MSKANVLTRVVQAENSSDLSEHKSHVQILRGVGLAGQTEALGFVLTRALHSNRSSEIMAAVHALSYRIAVRAPGGALLDPDQRLRAASIALATWKHPTCTACHGLGYETERDTPMLSDRACASCRGSGKRALEAPAQLSAAASWAAAEIERTVERYSRRVGQKLGRG